MMHLKKNVILYVKAIFLNDEISLVLKNIEIVKFSLNTYSLKNIYYLVLSYICNNYAMKIK